MWDTRFGISDCGIRIENLAKTIEHRTKSKKPKDKGLLIEECGVRN